VFKDFESFLSDFMPNIIKACQFERVLKKVSNIFV
jgi:hypothetical protein